MNVDGKCFCGHIEYAAEVDPKSALICHCSDCQNHSGTAYGVVVGIVDENEIVLQKQVGDGAGGVVSANALVIDDTKIEIQDGTNLKGAEYAEDYSTNYTDRSLIDKGFIDPTILLAKNIHLLARKLKKTEKTSISIENSNNVHKKT